MVDAAETGLEIAVIGMAARFPRAKNIKKFWANLTADVESVYFFSNEELSEAGIPVELLNNPDYVKAFALLEDIEYFDASFFGYTPKESEIMDPQTRIFHECVWTALEDAGYDPGSYDGLIGLYAGSTPNLYWSARVILSEKSKEFGLFAARHLMQKDYLSLRISYKLNLMGPSYSLYTACSTSLVSIHAASQAILSGECDMALSGGVTVAKYTKDGYMYQEGMVLSPDGHCRTFDANAKGFVCGDGSGVVVLKRFEEAKAQRDNIYAVIKGSAINNDGLRKAGFSASSVEGQAEVIKMAMQVAEVEPESISYIETHGTGTELGDPVEIEGLRLAFNTNKKGFCGIGSVKSNMGHLDSAAGVAGFIKTVMALKHKLIPKSLHFETPNPKIDLINSPFYVVSSLSEWVNRNGKLPLRAGVSSFGIGGTNAHVVLEEAPRYVIDHSSAVIGENRKDREYQLILLSAKTEIALKHMMENLADYLKSYPGINLADAAYTLQVGRKAFEHRWMTVISTGVEAIAALDSPGGKFHTISSYAQSMPIEKAGPAADKQSLGRIGELWLQGHNFDWQDFYSREERYRLSLPTYPFEKQRYWIEADVWKTIAEIAQRSSQPGKQNDISGCFYIPTWKRTPLMIGRKTLPPDNVNGYWVVFMNDLCISLRLVERLKNSGLNLVMVKVGNGFSQVEDSLFTINPRESNHYETLFGCIRTSWGLPDKVIHLWNLTGEGLNIFNPESFDNAQSQGFFSLLYTMKAMGVQDSDHEVQIVVLTDYVQDVLGDEPLSPEKATIPGLLKVIPQEYPGVKCSHIDILPRESGSSIETVLIDRLVEEFIHNQGEAVIAYRNNQRWIQTFEPLHLKNESGTLMPCPETGGYLIINGNDGPGLVISEVLTRVGTKKLAFVGIPGFPSQEEWNQWLSQNDETDPVTVKIKKLSQLEKIGVDVLFFNANTADKKQMQMVVAQVEKKFGRINGVILNTSLTGDGLSKPIQELSPADCQRLFQAKVDAMMVMEDLFKEKKLDFFWVFSSLSSILGGLKLGALSAANSFINLFIKRHNRPGGNCSHWNCFNCEQMTLELSNVVFAQFFTLETVDQIIVYSEGNLQARIDDWIILEGVKEQHNYNVEEIKTRTYPRPDLPIPYTVPVNSVEKALTSIWEDFFGYARIGIHDDFFQLGGDSLKLITLVSKIQKKMKVLIPIPEFFNRPTVKRLAEFLLEETGKESNIQIEPGEEKEYYNLTSAQKSLYVIQQMSENNSSYNLFNTLILKGEGLRDRLEQIFRKLIERHGALRTSFEVVNNEPVQRVYKEVDFSIDFYDLTETGDLLDYDSLGETPGEPLISQAIRGCIRPFNLSRAPLFRAGMIKTHKTTYILVTDMHHVISDGYSMEILIKEFLSLYKEKKLPLLMLRYSDYCQWLQKGKILPSLQQQEEYWLKEFDSDIPELQMPTDYERPAVQSFEGDSITVILDENESAGLQEIAARVHATSFMVLIAIYNVLLAKLSGQEDIVVGIGIAGRRYEELQKIIGMFVNTLCIRNYPGREKTFKEFLREVKEKNLRAYQNQDYQFEELVRKVYRQGKKNRNPLFDAAIVSLDIEVDGGDASQVVFNVLEAKAFPFKNQVAKFDITLICRKNGDKFSISFEYCTKLFKSNTIERFILYFKEILAQVIENPDIKLKSITISHHLSHVEPYNPEMDLRF
jgi:acyl transferase domain-containing protein/acyl carrier protein